MPEVELGIESKNIATVAHEVLTEVGKLLKVVEIAVRMREKGYRPDYKPEAMVSAVRRCFGTIWGSLSGMSRAVSGKTETVNDHSK